MLVISPDECIDCGVCEPECPVDAIKADTDPGAEKWVVFNEKYSEIWPNITESKPALQGADDMANVEGKLDTHFSEAPAS